MVTVLRNADHSIKSFSEQEDFILQPGETLETIPVSFTNFAGRLKISVEGRSGETLFLPAGTSSIEIQVRCPGEDSLILEINNEIRRVSLADGCGVFPLELSDGQTYVLRPQDRVRFCAAGEGLMIIGVGKT